MRAGYTIVDKGMLRSSRSFLVIALAAGVAGAAEIPQGAHVLLRMENSISTRTAQEGDYVYLRTASPVAVDGQIAGQSKRNGPLKDRVESGHPVDALTLVSSSVGETCLPRGGLQFCLL